MSFDATLTQGQGIAAIATSGNLGGLTFRKKILAGYASGMLLRKCHSCSFWRCPVLTKIASYASVLLGGEDREPNGLWISATETLRL